MQESFISASLAFSVLAPLALACHVDAKVNASASEGDSRIESSMTETTTAAPPPPPLQMQTAVPPSAPPADACPLSCYEARGADKAPLTGEETTQLRSALEPIVSRMRQCVTPEEWRRRGSPMMNLRLAPDGTLADFGVDPDEVRDSLCLEDAGRGASASVTLPNRKVVRCRERCVQAADASRARTRRAR
jgi:hypothetical protein